MKKEGCRLKRKRRQSVRKDKPGSEKEETGMLKAGSSSWDAADFWTTSWQTGKDPTSNHSGAIMQERQTVCSSKLLRYLSIRDR